MSHPGIVWMLVSNVMNNIIMNTDIETGISSFSFFLLLLFLLLLLLLLLLGF